MDGSNLILGWSMPPARIVTVVVATLMATEAAAQTPASGKISVSVFGGVAMGGELWMIPSQRVGVLSNTGTEISVDTMGIRRTVRSGLVVGISGTSFVTPNLGFGFELSYFGPSRDDECEIVFDSRVNQSNPNRGMCDDITARTRTVGAINITASGYLRPFPTAVVSPYFRAIAGVADLSGSTTGIVGRYNGTDREVIRDQSGSRLGVTFGGGAGVVIPWSQGYAVRVEVRDQMYFRDVLDGPADAIGVAPISTSLTHNVVLTFAVDIYLERRRGRRY